MNKIIKKIMTAVMVATVFIPVKTFAQGNKPLETSQIKISNIDPAKASEDFKSAVDNILEADNFEIIMKALVNHQGADILLNGEGLIRPDKDSAFLKFTGENEEFKIYVMDGDTYTFKNNEWEFIKSEEHIKKFFGDKKKVDFEKILSKCDFGVSAIGTTVIKNKTPLNSEEFINFITEEDNILKDVDEALKQVSKDITYNNISFVIDKDKKMSKILLDAQLTINDKPSKLAFEVDFLNIDTVKKEIEIPEEAKSKKDSDTPIKTVTIPKQ